jgi:hypothetical protein
MNMKENNTIEKFAEVGRHPAYTFEYKMARAYRSALGDLESAKRDSELPRIEYAHRRLAEIQTDIEKFMDIVGGYSRRDVAERLHQCKLDITEAKCLARNTLSRAIQENPELSPDNVEKLDEVRAAFAERDRIIAVLMPIAVDLERKLMNAEEILKKYG